MADITKEKLVEILRGLLETYADLGLLMGLKKTEIETLIACIRNMVEEVECQAYTVDREPQEQINKIVSDFDLSTV